ncbi:MULTISPECIES: CvfB family protein [Spirosoma]|uniref:S1-like domain-containing RNA-binding protein n=1 Tax=Spirosoma liriopis TaxID=2937440 RepID=A0ABT0HND4_9BACT|nr:MULTISPECIES: S1-like domain-containing RNA-binding protein [Spirosoma]MCK8493387.1 S1-like domain-containing RNA-binding protein [Spirosoma liriopis]UHG92771.1 S1-like domain-containing RNA-binding protein [Spirosoma oryzicola]
MIEIGRMNKLTALRATSVGFFLGESDSYNSPDDVLLPNKYVPASLAVGDEIEVFIYTDSEDRPIATTLTPHIMRDEFAPLPVVSVTNVGAFLDWGLEKDLLVPFREQSRPMVVGKWYVVYMYLDKDTGRLVASSKVSRFLDDDVSDLCKGDDVDLLVYESTDLGFNVIINDRFQGLLYHTGIFRPVQPGDRMPGFIKHIRDDKLIDVSLQQEGFQNVEPSAQQILDALNANNGFLPLNDKSDPQLIYQTLEMSKKTFKKAIGTLYKERKIVIQNDGIALV